MSVRSHETQFEQSYERKTKNDVGVFKLLAATIYAFNLINILFFNKTLQIINSCHIVQIYLFKQ